MKATGAHQKADANEKRNHPLPDSIEYQVRPEIAKTLRAPSAHSVDPHGTSTLVQKEVATLIYMDVGRWSGSAPTEHDTQSHWGKHRDFGIVCGRLAVLCTYTGDPSSGGPDDPIGINPKTCDFSKNARICSGWTT